MRRTLLSPTCAGASSERLKKIGTFYECCQRAEQEKNLDTFCRAVNALCFAGTYLYADNSESFDFDKRFAEYEKYLTLSQMYDEMNHAFSSSDLSEEDGAFRQSMGTAQNAKMNECCSLLKKYDVVMRMGPTQLAPLPKIDLAGEIEKLRTDQPLEEKETPLYADNSMSAEDAQKWLREKILNM
jgi:hypothetical protein